jgi:hypothetical protein
MVMKTAPMIPAASAAVLVFGDISRTLLLDTGGGAKVPVWIRDRLDFGGGCAIDRIRVSQGE